MIQTKLPPEVTNPIGRFFAAPLKKGDQGKTYDIRRSSLEQDEAMALASLVHSLAPRQTLEIGFANGGSCLVIAAVRHALGIAGRHVVLDPYQTTFCGGVGLMTIRSAGLEDAVEWLPKRAEDFLPAAYLNGQRFDFVFDDAGKTIGEAVVNAFYIDKLLNLGGIVAFHDGLTYARSLAVSYLVRQCGYEVLPFGPDSVARACLRSIRYSFLLGRFYAMHVIPKIFRGIVVLQKPTIPRPDVPTLG